MEPSCEELPSMERLRWACRRGLLELDLLFEAFLVKRYSDLPDRDKAEFIRLLEYPDQTLQAWLLGKEPPEDEGLKPIIQSIRDCM
jgi:antitoxin CptB